jgi:hypothetical protein
MWYMRDGAPAHFSRAVRDALNNVYHDRWIGRGGPTAWLPRSPNLNPPVGTPKCLVYAAPVDNGEALHQRTVDACQTIRNCPGNFERLRRSKLCIEAHGGHFEQLPYMYSFSYNSQMKCFATS